MSPAFSSTRQAAAFAFLLAALLLLPAVAGKSRLPTREQLYSSVSWGEGGFPYLHDQIFEEKEDIDIAFMGSSKMWWGIDTPKVEAQLSEKLGHKAVVRSLCWNSPGFDAFYFILRDLLEHRKVRVVVFCDMSGGGNTAHPRASHWFRWADNADAIADLGLRSKTSYYASALVGLPRNLVGLMRDNLPAIPSDEISWGEFYHIKNPAQRLGALAMPMRLDQPFAPYAPVSSATPADVCIYSKATEQFFHFSGGAIAPMQAAFARKIGALAQAHHVKLVYLHMPRSDEIKSSVIEEPAYWPDLFHADVSMVGIPPVKLYRGISEENILKLFYNFEHFDQNGQEYFTPIITPCLEQIYEDQAKP